MDLKKNKLVDQIKERKEREKKAGPPDTKRKRELQRLRAQIKRLTKK